jgi:hypothetical protein
MMKINISFEKLEMNKNVTEWKCNCSHPESDHSKSNGDCLNETYNGYACKCRGGKRVLKITVSEL